MGRSWDEQVEGANVRTWRDSSGRFMTVDVTFVSIIGEILRGWEG